MIAKPDRNIVSEIGFLTRALKAPSLAGAVERLAERARAESWSHEEFLAACLQREVAARESHGGEGRSRPARIPLLIIDEVATSRSRPKQRTCSSRSSHHATNEPR